MDKTVSTGQIYHVPALLPETLGLMNIKPQGVYIDATFGGGGHSKAILKLLDENGRLYSFDRDLDAFHNSLDDARFKFVHGNFRHIENFMEFYEENKVDGILADLGVSFHHFDDPERGFSFRADAPLDMRMNQKAEKKASEILAEADEKILLSLLKEYADLKRPQNVVKAISSFREKSPIETTFQLAEAMRSALDPRQEKKEMAQVFQALRIATNHEKDDLALFLRSTLRVLKPGGRLAVLTYHSVEDRMVKNFMKTGNTEGLAEKDFFGNVFTPWKMITRKPVEPSLEEIERNPRSRSARLRVAELLDLSNE